jgi:hypothetical protein
MNHEGHGGGSNRRAILGGWLGEGNAYPLQYWYVAATWGGSEVTASERTLFWQDAENVRQHKQTVIWFVWSIWFFG